MRMQKYLFFYVFCMIFMNIVHKIGTAALSTNI